MVEVPCIVIFSLIPLVAFKEIIFFSLNSVAFCLENVLVFFTEKVHF